MRYRSGTGKLVVVRHTFRSGDAMAAGPRVAENEKVAIRFWFLAILPIFFCRPTNIPCGGVFFFFFYCCCFFALVVARVAEPPDGGEFPNKKKITRLVDARTLGAGTPVDVNPFCHHQRGERVVWPPAAAAAENVVLQSVSCLWFVCAPPSSLTLLLEKTAAIVCQVHPSPQHSTAQPSAAQRELQYCLLVYLITITTTCSRKPKAKHQPGSLRSWKKKTMKKLCQSSLRNSAIPRSPSLRKVQKKSRRTKPITGNSTPSDAA
ncbi:hypothetical protein FN846DRAFT_147976 [Sphaerosporella brunnea]|uniref:Uncharacterized protein n=1 Tax=Sphaerosporella brunnea TaxID=1250544 RepID=A0A5J5EQL9_9PEZI|nr:hypothetical protein FN846DRAFT_147976 [Sphaerosporella brunnea]